MNIRAFACAALSTAVFAMPAQTPENLVVEGIAPHSEELKREAGRYLEFRAASFLDWHPSRRELLISTRFADTPQLHIVTEAGGTRRQITFQPEPVSSGSFDPKVGEFLVFAQDTGGGEFHQFYRYDFTDGKIQLLTDGKSRNTGLRWSRTGDVFAYASTRRNGRDNDIWLMVFRRSATWIFCS